MSTLHPMLGYAPFIREVLAKFNRREVDPRHVEAYMRIAHSTLDGLTREEFALDVAVAIQCIDDGGVDAAERLAVSYDL